ncbi:Tip elongation aberrant protein 1 [Leucoagaricus sp. SymC.cos]|nr:Tip elongation aberrant protein 1 [Leucoagaricus sp. SymC.cos]
MTDLADLADLVLSECQESPEPSVPTSGLWSYRRPIVLHITGSSAPSELSPSPFPRYDFGLAATKKGDVYFCGGLIHDHPGLLYHYSAKDNTATVLQCSGDDPGPRYEHAMTMVGNNVIALHGGYPCNSREAVDPSLFLFNLVSRKWLKVPVAGSAPGSRQGHSMVVIGTTIFMFGGWPLHGSERLDELWAFDLRTIHTQPRWELVTPSSTGKPPPRDDFVFVPHQNQLMLFGGYGEEYLADTWAFDTNTKRWSELQCVGDVPSPRDRAAGAVLDDVMYIIGGCDQNAGYNDVFALKISEHRWFRVEGIGKVENHLIHAVACIGTKIFIFGGEPSHLEDKQDMVAVLDTKYINNSELHTPERLLDLDTDPDIGTLSEVNRENSRRLASLEGDTGKLEKRLAELERSKGEVLRENSKLKERCAELEERLAELEEDGRQAKRQELIAAILKSTSKANSLANLQGMDAQTMADFLTEVLENQALLQSDAERRHILYLLRKVVKSAQVLPIRTGLYNVQCDLVDPINSLGGYGLIYQGVFEGQVAQIGELALPAHVSHPNVIPLYGSYLSAERIPRICIVSPWMENGDLVDYLANLPDTPLIPLMSDVAAGLQFLHDMGIVHADLKARNVLVSRTQRAMLTDFGILTVLNTSMGSSNSASFSGTTYWMAPELLVAEEVPPPTPQSDMWGFGCTCFEAMTGQTPFLEFYKYPGQLIGAFVRGYATPLRPKRNCPPTITNGGPLVTLAERCWNYEPSERPTAAEAFRFLTELNVEDNRPSMDEELAMFEAVKNKRPEVKIDYRYLLSVVRKARAIDNHKRECHEYLRYDMYLNNV